MDESNYIPILSVLFPEVFNGEYDYWGGFFSPLAIVQVPYYSTNLVYSIEPGTDRAITPGAFALVLLGYSENDISMAITNYLYPNFEIPYYM